MDDTESTLTELRTNLILSNEEIQLRVLRPRDAGLPRTLPAAALLGVVGCPLGLLLRLSGLGRWRLLGQMRPSGLLRRRLWGRRRWRRVRPCGRRRSLPLLRLLRRVRMISATWRRSSFGRLRLVGNHFVGAAGTVIVNPTGDCGGGSPAMHHVLGPLPLPGNLRRGSPSASSGPRTWRSVGHGRERLIAKRLVLGCTGPDRGGTIRHGRRHIRGVRQRGHRC
mmetsp:Transcript_115002/g.330337  ORF Transcript_115002/g.330337 Transcript_115002/m.330337 type:complete len:223 (+) Transcript_115002:2924-3592(+)